MLSHKQAVRIVARARRRHSKALRDHRGCLETYQTYGALERARMRARRASTGCTFRTGSEPIYYPKAVLYMDDPTPSVVIGVDEGEAPSREVIATFSSHSDWNSIPYEYLLTDLEEVLTRG